MPSSESLCSGGVTLVASAALPTFDGRGAQQTRTAVERPNEGTQMAQPGSRIFDDFSRLMSDASGLASGVRREIETAVRGQVERLLAAMDVVSREEFEAVKTMAGLARDENERLEARIVVLEKKLGVAASPPPGAAKMDI